MSQCVAAKWLNASSADHYVLSHDASGNGEDAVYPFEVGVEIITHRSDPLTKMFSAHISWKC